jgi:hypothetical protein
MELPLLGSFFQMPAESVAMSEFNIVVSHQNEPNRLALEHGWPATQLRPGFF